MTRFFGIDERDGMVNIPGPISAPQLEVDESQLPETVVYTDEVQTLTNKTLDTANNDITVAQADVTGLTAALALKLDAASYTPTDVLTKLLTVDGAGSGLDADTLDGASSAGFLQTTTYEALTPNWSGNHTWLDNAVIRIGTGADLQLLHDGADSFVRSGTGRLFVSGATGGGGGTVPSGFEAGPDLGLLAAQTVIARGNSGTAGPNVDLLYYRSSFSSPTAPLSTHTLGQYRFRGHDSTAPRTSATIAGIANENWSAGSAYGTDVRIQTIAAGATALATRMTISSAATTLVGNLVLGTAGNLLSVKEGTNAAMGVATLVLGTVVVNTTLVTANSRIQLTTQSLGTVTVPSALAVSARTAGTSFTILASALTDTSVVAWQITEPA